MSLIFPASPTDGQVELLGGRQYIYSAAKARWENYGGFAQISYTRPTAPAQGELFFNPDANLFEVWDVNQWKQLSTGGGEVTPIGTIQYFSATVAPTGFLICNGDTIPNGTGTVQGVTADFSSLYAVIGSTFGGAGKLPDLRGEFIRGADEGRGVDSGRVLGSGQGEDFKSHNHDFMSPLGDANDSTSQGWTPTGGTHDGFRTSDRVPSLRTEAAIVARGGSETRPRNVALLPCIKYSGFQVVPAVSTTAVDPRRSDVLFHLPGNDLTDISQYGYAVNAFGNATAGNATSKWGGGSVTFDGAGDYLRFELSGALQMDFTAEAWIYPDVIPTNTKGIFFIGRPTSDNNWRIQLEIEAAGNMQVYMQGGSGTENATCEGTTILTAATWHHVAITKKSNAVYLFVNGQLDNMIEITNINWDNAFARDETTCHWGIGRNSNTPRYFDGKIEEMRITSPPRYLGNYPLPTAPYPTAEPYQTVVEQPVSAYSQTSAALTASPSLPSVAVPTGVSEIKIMAPSLAAFSGGDFPCFRLGTGGAAYTTNTYVWSLNGDFGSPPSQDFGQNNAGDDKFVIYPANQNDALFVDITLMRLTGNVWQQTTIFNSNAGSSNVTSGTVQGTVALPGELDSIWFISSTPGNGLFYGNTPNPHDTSINVFYR